MIEKPKFPEPRLIREDFLPNEPMSKYRIKKVTDADGTRYYPQKKFFFWWEYLNSPSFNNFGFYRTYDEARFDIQKRMKNEKTVEYFYDLDL